MERRILACCAALLAAGLLAGCATAPEAESSATRTSTPTPSPSATALPTAAPTATGSQGAGGEHGSDLTPVLPDISSLVITPFGLFDPNPAAGTYAPGSIFIASNALGSDPQYSLVDPASECQISGGRYWDATYPDEPSGAGSTAFEVGLSDVTGVFGIAVFSPKIRTELGIHVGSTRSEALAAYPDALFAFSAGGRDRYMVPAGLNNLYIDVGTGSDPALPAETVVSVGNGFAGIGVPEQPLHIRVC